MIEVVVSDFGGVLTTPLATAFTRVQDHQGIAPGHIAAAMTALTEEHKANPLHEMECGRIAEPDFLDMLAGALQRVTGEDVDLSSFSDVYWSALEHNDEMLDWLRSAKARGMRLALLTNNVQEWEPRWRPKWPIDELFELVVDSGFVGVRKPDPKIYAITTERLDCAPEQCVLVDDMALNCDAARAEGWSAVRFDTTPQTVAELEELLGEV